MKPTIMCSKVIMLVVVVHEKHSSRLIFVYAFHPRFVSRAISPIEVPKVRAFMGAP